MGVVCHGEGTLHVYTHHYVPTHHLTQVFATLWILITPPPLNSFTYVTYIRRSNFYYALECPQKRGTDPRPSNGPLRFVCSWMSVLERAVCVGATTRSGQVYHDFEHRVLICNDPAWCGVSWEVYTVMFRIINEHLSSQRVASIFLHISYGEQLFVEHYTW